MNELDHPVKNCGIIAVKTDDKPCLDLHAVPVKFLDTPDNVSVTIDRFPRLFQAFMVQRLDTYENLVKPCFHHHLDQ